LFGLSTNGWVVNSRWIFLEEFDRAT
jgi:hypothetical protein